MFSSNTSQVSNDAVYIEDVFSTWLYTGNGSTQTITNGIDLSGKGGMVWVKSRSDAYNGWVFDTQRGANKYIVTNLTSDQGNDPTLNWSFLSNGFSQNNNQNSVNLSGTTYASWTFRKQPKFFDVVTYTGNGTAGRTVAHSLGSVPGFIIIKATGVSNNWVTYHRSMGNTSYMFFNTTGAQSSVYNLWNNTTPTATEFTLGSDSYVNANGYEYVAYLFAHDAGGFGLTGTDNVISCGSYTGNGTTGLAVTLGYEPQWVMVKCSSAAQADGWIMVDTMRSMDNSANRWLKANTATAESAESPRIVPTATGFTLSSNAAVNTSGATYIYIAIRRGPMKTPTSGTSVFQPVAQTGDSNISVGFPTDFGLRYNRAGGATIAVDRLRGSVGLYTPLTDAESAASTVKFDQQNLMTYGLGAGASVATYQWRRAPGFFDEVCYTGTGSGAVQNVAHNLTVVPEMMIVKCRSAAGDSWIVYHSAVGNTRFLQLNSTAAFSTFGVWNNTTPTASVFTVGNDSSVNVSGGTYVNYLFASCPGVSKVGSYTGTGTTQQINCGFTAGARFVLIKRTDSTGDWYVWDSARGIVAGNDPYLLLNSTAAEVTTTDYVDTFSSGFEISSTAPAAINASGGTFIYLAIA